MITLKDWYGIAVFTTVWYAMGLSGAYVLEIEHFAYIMLWGAFAGLVCVRVSDWAIGRKRITLLLNMKDKEGE
jgi:hypothetical protein